MLQVLHIIAMLAMIVLIVLILLVLFEPPLRYRVKAPAVALDSQGFVRLLAALSDSQLHCNAAIEPLSNGRAFYEAELAAIAAATHSVHIEAFIFHPSAIGDRFLAALAERARCGVRVRIVVDAVGSFPTPRRYFDPLRQAGGQAYWYQPLQWGTLKRLNNRTHRELIVVDGRVGFIGGAGIAAHWDVGPDPDRQRLPPP
jgi:cardiolipin synthase